MEEELTRYAPESGVSRREFMGQLGLLAALAAVYPSTALAARRDADPLPAWALKDPWLTLAQVQEHLFPKGDDIPGATALRTVVYLYNTIETRNADYDDREFILNGVRWLNNLTTKEHGRVFHQLNEDNKESALRKIEASRAGRRWLSLILTYLIEALLADPVYGGNADGAGWQWLQHQPGFPKPPSDKTWYQLAAPVHFQRKAGDA